MGMWCDLDSTYKNEVGMKTGPMEMTDDVGAETGPTETYEN